MIVRSCCEYLDNPYYEGCGMLNNTLLNNFSLMNDGIEKGMRDIRNDIFKNDPFVKGYKKSCKMMGDSGYELYCGGKKIMEKNINICGDCIHKKVCCFDKQVAEDIQKVEAVIGRSNSNRLIVTYQCKEYLPVVSQENPAFK